MKLTHKHIFALVLFFLVGWLAKEKFRDTGKNKNYVGIELSKNEPQVKILEKNQIAVQSLQTQKNETKNIDNPIDNSENPSKVETFEERYKKRGFIQDPDNTNQMMKKIVNRDGKERTLYVNKIEDFEPIQKTIKNAIEVLEIKNGLNPADEMLTLRPLDMSLQENQMLTGSFRDEEMDLEIYLAKKDVNTNENGNDIVCFISPKLKINIARDNNKAILHADDTGYAVVKLNETLYARLTWSFEKRRTLHGDILSFKNNAFVKTGAFVATEINFINGDALKYCQHK